MVFIILILIFSYVLLLLMATFIWRKGDVQAQDVSNGVYRRISVIVPVRNESANIGKLLKGLEKQTYPKDSYEVIIVDDGSEDDTEAVSRECSKRCQMKVRFVSLASDKLEGKKHALTKGIALSNGELIAATDGDCYMGEEWLDLINSQFGMEQLQLLAGPVVFEKNGFFGALQWVEFSCLIGLGAVSISLKRPFMGNGANLAYRKTAFESVDGYKGNFSVQSGDDEFLIKRIAAEFGPDTIGFARQKGSIVYTNPLRSLRSLFHQKIRWASKWKNHNDAASLLTPAYIFLVNLAWIAAFLSFFMGYLPLSLTLIFCISKLLSDSIFANAVASDLGRKHHFLVMLLLEFIYPWYVITFGMCSIFCTYQWKGRKINE